MIKRKDIISIQDFSKEELLYLIKKARKLKSEEKNNKRYHLKNELLNKRMALLFYENSTRTRTSFETGMHELGGTYFGFSGPEGTSLMKKENILATVMMYWANHADIMVMRHPKDGALQWVADILDIPVINGGDGKNEHPTQALLDLMTLDELHPGIDGLNIGFGGDMAHGRTIRSNCQALSKFDNITIHWSASNELGMPNDLVKYLKSENVKVIRHKKVEDVISNCDVYYMTRPQKERIEGLSEIEINELLLSYRINMNKISKNPKVKILHPLPVDSSISEIDIDVFYSDNQYFFAQAENGIFLRKALILELLKNKEHITFHPQIKVSVPRSNNRKRIPIKNNKAKTKIMYVDLIDNGVVIDHINNDKISLIDKKLRFSKRGYEVAIVTNESSKKFSQKGLLKIKNKSLTRRELKEIAIISPNATFNIIENGAVVEKFKYLLCQNKNCITRVIEEDVPPKFNYFKNKTFCHYCKREYIE